jgi:hypothetical protein
MGFGIEKILYVVIKGGTEKHNHRTLGNTELINPKAFKPDPKELSSEMLLQCISVLVRKK